MLHVHPSFSGLLIWLRSFDLNDSLSKSEESGRFRSIRTLLDLVAISIGTFGAPLPSEFKSSKTATSRSWRSSIRAAPNSRPSRTTLDSRIDSDCLVLARMHPPSTKGKDTRQFPKIKCLR